MYAEAVAAGTHTRFCTVRCLALGPGIVGLTVQSLVARVGSSYAVHPSVHHTALVLAVRLAAAIGAAAWAHKGLVDMGAYAEAH